MSIQLWRLASIAVGGMALAFGSLRADERTEHFDRDPGWDGRNFRSTAFAPRDVRQDFGFKMTSHAGGKPGELGGFITPAAEPAYYAKKIPAATFADPLEASGSFAATGRAFHILIGFFNADTLNEWRTPNTIALRISGRGDVFYAWLEYATSRWRAGGDSPKGFSTPEANSKRTKIIEFRLPAQPHHWTIRYDPAGNGGDGSIIATIDKETAICHLAKGHKADGATFNRCGLLNVMKSAAAGGEVWLDDMEINGVREDFAVDPMWDCRNNQRTYRSTNVRPRFDFGYSATHYASGKQPGELGGLIFRGDCRYPERLAYYGDRLSELGLDKPLIASGQVCLRRGVTDSTVLLGFFHSKDSTRVNPSQESGLPSSFLGVQIDGPSREGFFFAPAYRMKDGKRSAVARGAPHILPDGSAHSWTLHYRPGPPGSKGQIQLSLDRQSVFMDVSAAPFDTRFDRFGIITTWIDGNGQQIYFDDLTYTCKQP